MNEIFKELNFDNDETLKLLNEYDDIIESQFVKIVAILRKYNCHDEYIKEIIIKRKDIFRCDSDRIEYTLESIKANNDAIEDILLELV